MENLASGVKLKFVFSARLKKTDIQSEAKLKKNFIFLILIAALAGGAFFFYSSSNNKETELQELRSKNQELQPLRAEHEELEKLRTQIAEANRQRQDHEELIRLRGKVAMLQTEKEKLGQQLQQATALISDSQQRLQTQQAQNQQIIVQSAQQNREDSARNKCINNLRQLDGAIQQWALENKKDADALVTANDVAPYLRQYPVCPAGGIYTLSQGGEHRVGEQVKCNIPGHALP